MQVAAWAAHSGQRFARCGVAISGKRPAAKQAAVGAATGFGHKGAAADACAEEAPSLATAANVDVRTETADAATIDVEAARDAAAVERADAAATGAAAVARSDTAAIDVWNEWTSISDNVHRGERTGCGAAYGQLFRRR